MDRSNAILYESGRFPLWLRVPALVFAIFMLWLGAAIASADLFGVSLGLPKSDEHGSPWLGALLAFAMSSIWMFVWFARIRVLFDPKSREFVLWNRGYFSIEEHRVSIEGCSEIKIRHAHGGFAGRRWRVMLEYPDGRSEWLVDLPCKVNRFAESLGKVSDLKVTKHSGGH